MTIAFTVRSYLQHGTEVAVSYVVSRPSSPSLFICKLCCWCVIRSTESLLDSLCSASSNVRVSSLLQLNTRPKLDPIAKQWARKTTTSRFPSQSSHALVCVSLVVSSHYSPERRVVTHAPIFSDYGKDVRTCPEGWYIVWPPTTLGSPSGASPDLSSSTHGLSPSASPSLLSLTFS